MLYLLDFIIRFIIKKMLNLKELTITTNMFNKTFYIQNQKLNLNI